jgi:hypothetical protein
VAYVVVNKNKGKTMRPYERIIIERLDGDTPKEKYDNLIKMQQLLQRIAFPRRGLDEEKWTVEIMAEKAAEIILLHKEY